MVTVVRESVVPAAPDQVWERVVSPAGINHELLPWMRMVLPRRWRGAGLEEVPLDQPLGNAWLLYLGVLPLDVDRLRVTELVPGSHFQERSTMLTMRRWDHRRTLTPTAAGTLVRDEVEAVPRVRLLTPVVARIVGALFTHRHRRLRAWFG